MLLHIVVEIIVFDLFFVLFFFFNNHEKVMPCIKMI